jgi:D-sedoheptulose 7-phosphate isomerase
LELDVGLDRLAEILHAAHKAGGKAIFIGNGGSAAIASHMAVDYSKNKGVRSVALNDAAMLTMLANDYGYEQVFAKQIAYYGRRSDVAVIISSSGRSLNIIAAADAARDRNLRGVVTLSGMNPHNALRTKGDLNFYVPCTSYGLVELTHLALLHSLVPC